MKAIADKLEGGDPSSPRVSSVAEAMEDKTARQGGTLLRPEASSFAKATADKMQGKGVGQGIVKLQASNISFSKFG
jgi:hypothetical protein